MSDQGQVKGMDNVAAHCSGAVHWVTWTWICLLLRVRHRQHLSWTSTGPWPVTSPSLAWLPLLKLFYPAFSTRMFCSFILVHPVPHALADKRAESGKLCVQHCKLPISTSHSLLSTAVCHTIVLLNIRHFISAACSTSSTTSKRRGRWLRGGFLVSFCMLLDLLTARMRRCLVRRIVCLLRKKVVGRTWSAGLCLSKKSSSFVSQKRDALRINCV